MRLPIITTIFFLVLHNTYAQRISTGITIGSPAIHRTTLPDNYLFPTNSYFIYYTANSDKEDKPVFDQYFNGLNGGVNINLDYKRWMLSTEFLAGQTTIRLPILYLSYLGTALEDNWSTMEVVNTQFQANLLLNVRLNTKGNGAFCQGGMQFARNNYNEKSDGLDANISSSISLWISDYEMYKTLYSNNLNKINTLIGLGYKYNDTYTSLRYTHQLSNDTNNPLAKYFRIDAVHARTLNFQKLKKGHKIYVEN